jgi:hypothetical protein
MQEFKKHGAKIAKLSIRAISLQKKEYMVSLSPINK